jgi:hypothetical protein
MYIRAASMHHVFKGKVHSKEPVQKIRNKYSQKRVAWLQSQFLHLCTYLWAIYIFPRTTIDLHILHMWTDPHRHKNVEFGTNTAQVPEYINGIFVAV